MARGKVVVAVRLPEVPVMVSVDVPTAAVLLAVRVSVLEPVVGFGVKAAVTPAGKPVTARCTLPVNPYWGDTLSVAVPELPWPMDWYDPTETVKLGAETVKPRVVVAVRLPDVPVMVSNVNPTLAVLFAVSVRLLKPVVGFGEKDAVTPLGSPVTARLTLPVNPYCGVM